MVGSLAIPELLAPAAAYLENSGPVRVRIRLHREGNREAKTTLAVRMDEEGKETIRVPIHTDLPKYTDPTTGAEVEVDGDDVIVELALKRSPMQVVVDPDKIQIDPQPGNNYWRKPLRLRFTPVYTLLEEMDLTNNHDRLNLIAGPWLYTAPYSNPWYTRPTMAGFRVGTYQTREFAAGPMPPIAPTIATLWRESMGFLPIGQMVNPRWGIMRRLGLATCKTARLIPRLLRFIPGAPLCPPPVCIKGQRNTWNRF